MKEIIKKVAYDTGIKEPIVEAIIRSQFYFVRDVMEAGQFKSVLLPYFGKFCVKPTRLKYLEEKYGRREKEQDTENKRRMEELYIPESGDRKSSTDENGDM